MANVRKFTFNREDSYREDSYCIVVGHLKHLRLKQSTMLCIICLRQIPSLLDSIGIPDRRGNQLT